MTDIEEIKSLNPVNYSITVLKDNFPLIEILSPDKDVKMTDNDLVPLNLKISDDFGFSNLILNYKLSASRYDEPQKEFTKISLPFNKNSFEDIVYYNWDLSGLRLVPDDIISYYLEVFDNDYISGPKSTKSSLFSVRVPTLDELFADADKTHNKAESELTKTLNDAKELNEEFKKLAAELKRNEKEISWEEKDKIENALEKYSDLTKKVKDIQQQLAEMQKEMQEQNLLSEETLRKYMELQNLFDELNNEDLKKAFEKMQQMLENLRRDQVQQSFEDMKLNEEAFQKSIERTINLLKRIQIEQKVDELLKRTEEMSRLQEELIKNTNDTESGNKKSGEELSERQQDISQELQKFKEGLDDLKEKMNELNDMPLDELNKLLDLLFCSLI